MGQQKGLSPGARLFPSYLSFLICTMGQHHLHLAQLTILRLREHIACVLVNTGCSSCTMAGLSDGHQHVEADTVLLSTPQAEPLLSPNRPMRRVLSVRVLQLEKLRL